MTPRGCEAILSSRTINPGSTRYVDDFEGRRIDLGPNTPKRQAVAEVCISCQRCSILETITAVGEPPYGAINRADREARTFLVGNCPKWKELQVEEKRNLEGPWARLYRPTSPDSFFPK